MKKALRYMPFMALFLAFACADENFLRIPLGAQIQALAPDFSTGKRFVSNQGDSLTIAQISSSNTWERQTENLPPTSPVEYDYLLLEQQNIVLGTDTPFLRFNYNWQARYEPNSPRLGADELSVSYSQGNIEEVTLNFNYLDSLECQSLRCNFTDTLKLLNRTYINCYFTPRDSTTVTALYLNSRKGLVGFRTSNNLIFENID